VLLLLLLMRERVGRDAEVGGELRYLAARSPEGGDGATAVPVSSLEIVVGLPGRG
jgi:hypothetical protein